MTLLTQRLVTVAPRLEYSLLIALTEVTLVQTRDSLHKAGGQRLTGSSSSTDGGPWSITPILEDYSHGFVLVKDLPLSGELGNTSSFHVF